ncbi:MAG: CsbD family protein [Actinobacteria bacterium]|nr:CsbD family protein [Actinomycetota bacterium]
MADTPSNTDDAKGRVKEATGKLTGDKDLQNEGKLDQAEGKIKEGVDNLADKARNLLHKDKH